MRKLVLFLFVIMFILQASSIASADINEGLANSPWPCKGHDIRRSGCSNYNTTHIDGNILWKYNTSSMGLFYTPIIGKDGSIYVGTIGIEETSPSKLIALNPDGTLRWNYSVGASIGSLTLGEDGNIYFGTEDKKLYAVNTNGELEWTYTLNSSVDRSPIIDSEGTIYVTSKKGTFYAFRNDGTLKWDYRTENYLANSPAIGKDGTIYFAGGYKFYAFNKDGTIKWNTENKRETGCPSVSNEGDVYLGGGGYYLTALTSEGELKWSVKINELIDFDVSPMINQNGTIYIGTVEGNLYAYGGDGELKWKFNATYPIESSPTIGKEGTIYFGTTTILSSENPDSNYFYALYPNGTVKWKYSTNNKYGFSSSPSIGKNGNIYVANENGIVYAFGDEISDYTNGDEINNDSPSLSFKLMSVLAVVVVLIYRKK